MIDLPIYDAATSSDAPAETDAPKQRFWRSPADLKRDATFVERARHEFLPGATDAPSGASRRQFLQLMGASLAMAGLSACRRPVERILPYARKPEEIIPGIPVYYATGMPFRGVLQPLLAESHEGRPTKVEGNNDHPYAPGGSSIFAQASVLNLYDPDRSKQVLRDGTEATWGDFVDFVRDFAAEAATQRVVVMSEPTSSPTVQALRTQMQQRFPNMDWITYHGGGDDPGPLGTQQAFGRPLRPHYRFADARVIVSFDADFTGPTDPNGTRRSAAFAQSRKLASPDDEMSRLYVIESAYTTTGALADHRKRLRASDIPHFAAAVASQLGVGSGGSRFADDPYVAAIADDLRSAGGQAVVLAGETQPPEVHALCAALNGALGSTVVEYLDTQAETIRPQAEVLADLVQAMEGGEVDALIMLGVNPVYNAPASLAFESALAQVNETIHLGLNTDETARAARWHLPRTHYLEAWGDGRAYDGTLSVIQPLIAPLYEAAHSDIEVLSLLATGQDRAGYDIVREQWRNVITGSFEEGWRKVLHDGYLPDTQYATATPQATAPALTAMPTTAEDALEVVFRLDPTLHDGSFANNAWCQEMPDPMTKIVWDNVAVMSPATARRLGVASTYDEGVYVADMVELTVDGRSVQLPVWEMPGHPDHSILVNLGYGRTIYSNREPREAPFFDTDRFTDVYGDGAIATGVGVNVAPLRPTPSTAIVVGAQVTPTGETYEIVTTQDHGAIDPEARPLARMGTLEEYRANPDFAEEMNEPSPAEPFEEYPMLWESAPGGNQHPTGTPDYKDNLYYQNQWGMVIDMNACNGCNACIMACNSENNIQVVGKEEVGKGREMHWLRLDRYFVTSHEDMATHTEHEEVESEIPSDPMVMLQPVMCMHCENAPCESVCPVAATVHSPDGTNQMIYNRCIGTRYCSNNCPYKVRRYNWFNWTKTLPVEVQMAQNPNVSMRFRGVMEKCSWCVQRIRGAQRRANVEERNIRDGEVLTACQQACASDAIVFGDLNDPNSAVSKQKLDPRNYAMLAYLNVKPRLTYLARVRNPNPALEPAV